LSAVNEVAVEAFLQGGVRWHQIAEVNDAALQCYQPTAQATVADIIDADAAARRCAEAIIDKVRSQ
jgi:1-deoxy-D-xylulose-5-phosphate reductoisomerase